MATTGNKLDQHYAFTASTGEALTITLAALTGKSHLVLFLLASYDGDPGANGLLTVASAGTTFFSSFVTTGGPAPITIPPALQGAPGEALTITLAGVTDRHATLNAKISTV